MKKFKVIILFICIFSLNSCQKKSINIKTSSDNLSSEEKNDSIIYAYIESSKDTLILKNKSKLSFLLNTVHLKNRTYLEYVFINSLNHKYEPLFSLYLDTLTGKIYSIEQNNDSLLEIMHK